ncbi:MAG TPA: hypothetical protein VKA32_10660, partial [Gammaproteobacteria bacterium]|nr:hypothetical protein [Gammaproteobacteria bacterium]
DINGNRIFLVTENPLDAHTGDQVRLHWPVEHLHVFDSKSTNALFHGGVPRSSAATRTPQTSEALGA